MSTPPRENPVTAAVAAGLRSAACLSVPACRIPKFSGVHSLDLHLSGNSGAAHTAVTFIGLKGDFTPVGMRCAGAGVLLSDRDLSCCALLHAGQA